MGYAAPPPGPCFPPAGRECAPCHMFQSSDACPPECKQGKLDRDAMPAHVREMYDQRLRAFEEEKRREAGSKGGRDGSGVHQKVSASAASGVRCRMVTGIFWPLAVIQREGVAKPRKLTSITFNGRTYKGALFSPDMGRPIGSIEMESYDDKALTKARDL